MKAILAVLLIAALVLPLSGLVVAAQPSDTAPAPLGPEDVKPLRSLTPSAGVVDIAVTDITFDPSEPAAGQTVIISATIYNAGTEKVRPVLVEFFVDNTLEGEVTINGAMQPGASKVASIEWVPAEEITYTVTVVAIPVSVTDENTDNNTLEATVKVGGVADPTIGYHPSSFGFTATEGGDTPSPETLSIWNSGVGTLDWSVSDNADWLSLSPTSGSSMGETGEVTVLVSISGMDDGSYFATITISALEATNTPQTVPVSLTISPAGVEVPNKWAVVIGIADYRGRLNDLWHPDEDAMEMKEALITKYGFPEENIQMLLNKEATAQAIVDAIRWLAANEDADSTVVFFFCGHGTRALDTKGWDDDSESGGYDEGIVTTDMYVLPDGLSSTYVTLGNEFANFDTQKFALIFGSCYSGGMFDDNDDLQAPGRVICSACKADQYGWDYLELGNTLFGYYFVDEAVLQGLAEGLRVSGDGVSMEEALAYAYPLVTAQEPKSQPQFSDGFAGELVP